MKQQSGISLEAQNYLVQIVFVVTSISSLFTYLDVLKNKEDYMARIPGIVFAISALYRVSLIFTIRFNLVYLVSSQVINFMIEISLLFAFEKPSIFALEIIYIIAFAIVQSLVKSIYPLSIFITSIALIPQILFNRRRRIVCKVFDPFYISTYLVILAYSLIQLTDLTVPYNDPQLIKIMVVVHCSFFLLTYLFHIYAVNTHWYRPQDLNIRLLFQDRVQANVRPQQRAHQQNRPPQQNRLPQVAPLNDQDFMQSLTDLERSQIMELEGDCSVCLGSLVQQQLRVVKTRCRHTFHFDCINQWRLVSLHCPICRQQLIT